jgi:hypothetical protein
MLQLAIEFGCEKSVDIFFFFICACILAVGGRKTLSLTDDFAYCDDDAISAETKTHQQCLF